MDKTVAASTVTITEGVSHGGFHACVVLGDEQPGLCITAWTGAHLMGRFG